MDANSVINVKSRILYTSTSTTMAILTTEVLIGWRAARRTPTHFCPGGRYKRGSLGTEDHHDWETHTEAATCTTLSSTSFASEETTLWP
ncbi:Hypothetical predicted protein [Podarcis lilfordi]|uniref:Uncharacterized protein n=1 Tax=Podarcis lilfordi TaxID=74358 RepID=A0AA35JQE2_9SAUR|nr:Hypothetical predicted protein [Podarcis lilfordi]